MILTLTPNPTIDRVVFVRGFRWGAAVRGEREVVTPSGKGVDASLVLHELGAGTIALGLKAGLNGRLHEELLDQWGVAHDLLSASGETRMATVLVDLEIGQQSTITAPTLVASPDHTGLLVSSLERYAAGSWGAICAGSLPPGLPADCYAHLMRAARRHGLVTLLDTSGEALAWGVSGLPHVLKVNLDELVSLDDGLADVRSAGSDGGGQSPTSADAMLGAADALPRRIRVYLGVWASDALIVTLGRHGALALTIDGDYYARPLDVPVVNTAGAGDALNAGLMLARSRGSDWPAALALGTAAAASVVMNEGTAVCKRVQVESWIPQVRVQRIG